MFFKISQTKDPRFPVHYPLRNNYWLSCDTGWSGIQSTMGFMFFKGYCYESNPNSQLANKLFSGERDLTGNFVAVLVSDTEIQLVTDKDRSIPLIASESELGNIGFVGNPVWADTKCKIVDDQIITEQTDLIGTLNATRLEFNTAVDQIHQRLTTYFEWLGRRGRRARIFYSGGIDTLTCLSYLRSMRISHELIVGEHFDYDKFTTEFSDQLDNFWGYKQIHHWREHCYLVSGAPGDEYFMRGPTQVNYMLMHMGMKVSDILQPTDYHYSYFLSTEKLAMYEQQRQDTSTQELVQDRLNVCRQIINMSLNDHQHWHLGNTITFTPFRDVEILKTVLRLNDEDLVRNMANATVQRALIERNDPELLQFLPELKNQSRVPIYNLWSRLYSF